MQGGGGEPPKGSLGWAIDNHVCSLDPLVQKMNAEGAALQLRNKHCELRESSSDSGDLLSSKHLRQSCVANCKSLVSLDISVCMSIQSLGLSSLKNLKESDAANSENLVEV